MYTLEEIIQRLEKDWAVVNKSNEELEKEWGVKHEDLGFYAFGHCLSLLNNLLFDLKHIKK